MFRLLALRYSQASISRRVVRIVPSLIPTRESIHQASTNAHQFRYHGTLDPDIDGGDEQHTTDESKVDPDIKKRVLVGNLPFNTDWRELKDHMKSAGDVVHAHILTSYHGRSKGSGIVKFASEQSAQKAINELHNTNLMGRRISVREDRKEADYGKVFRVYIRNLPEDIVWQGLKDLTRVAGDVKFAQIIYSKDGSSTGCGFVEYDTEEEGRKAIDMLNKIEIRGQPLSASERLYKSHDVEESGNDQSKRVYVSNLSFDVKWQDLMGCMRTVGAVRHVKIITDRNGKSKGCAVVQLMSEDVAKSAIEKLNDTEFMGRRMFVREDREHLT